MAYQKKYYFQFTDPVNRVHVVELWQNTGATLTAEEIKGGVVPFSVELPELNHKFQVVRGTGATIQLFSDTDMKFYTGLKHVDPTEFMVKHYIDSALNWCGYLNSDMYSEPYDINFNYIITTTANDGFSLMDRFRFIQSDATNYVGIKSKWELLQICLNKLALPYTDIRVKLATTFSGFSGDSDSTILHESYVNCANFYDEDNLGMTLREVIESILAPYGAFIVQSGGSIYIVDIHTLAGGGSVTFQKFNASTYAYVSTVSVTVEKAISDVKYIGTGHGIERSGGTNRQVVVYSPYPDKTMVEQMITTPDEFTTIPSTFSDRDGYKYRTLEGHYFWQTVSPASFEESCKDLTSDRTVYVSLPKSGTYEPFLKILTPANIFKSLTGSKYLTSQNNYGISKTYLSGIAILVTGKILVKRNANPYVPTESSSIVKYDINFVTRIGSYYFDQSLNVYGGWSTSGSSLNNYIPTSSSGVIADTWVDIGENGQGFKIPINLPVEGQSLSGDFDFQIWSKARMKSTGKSLLPANGVSGAESFGTPAWIKDLQLSFVNYDGTEISDTDIEYIGLLNELYANAGETITLTTGTQSKFSDRAKIMQYDGSDYSDILEWTRDSQTYKIEELLLNSLCSNHQANYVTLTNMNLKNDFGLINVLTDTDYLPTEKLMVKSANINFAENSVNCNLVEISQDVLDIVKTD